MELLAVLAIILIIITPILAIAAFVRVQRIAEQLRGGSLLTLGDRLSNLERRLQSLEKSLSSQESDSSQESKPAPAQPVPTPPPLSPATTTPQSPPPLPPPLPQLSQPREVFPPAQVNVFAAPPLHSSKPKSSFSLDLETLIGGRWLNRIGIVAIISAATFFLKYAFDNNWIGPSGRVAIGILLGAAMLPWSHWLLQRGYSYFSEGIAGLGAAVMYLSIWAGCQYYKLFSLDVGFVAMIVVTAGMAAVALGRNSQRIALLSPRWVPHAGACQRRKGRASCSLQLPPDSRRRASRHRNAPRLALAHSYFLPTQPILFLGLVLGVLSSK